MDQVKTKRQYEKNRAVFNSVMPAYKELKALDGTLSCTGLYKSIGHGGISKATTVSSIIRATPSDFICEVEKIAIKSLDSEELRTFKCVFVYGDRFSVTDKNKKEPIQQKMGKQFLDRKIFPIEQYFKPKDIR